MGKFKDLTGMKFGKLLVLERKENSKDGQTQWLCQCECGNFSKKPGGNLRSGKSTHCSRKCYFQTENDKNTISIGQTFTRWTVIAKVSSTRDKWFCQCVCGNQNEVSGKYLRNGHSKSCGCLKNEVNRLPFGEASKNVVFRQYKTDAKKRSLSFELSFEEFSHLAQQNCHYCGIKPSTIKKTKKSFGVFIYNGIDRVDNTKGYTLSNCSTCCKKCNEMKSDLSYEEFLNHIKKIANIHNLLNNSLCYASTS